MPDEVETPEVEEESVDKSAQKTPKSFSQEEVDRFIKERVAREKSSKNKVQEDFDNYKKDIEEEVSYYKDILNKQLEDMKKEAPESVKKLLSKLSIKEQYEYLSDPNNAVILKKTVPLLPTPQGEVNPVDLMKNIKYRR